MARIGSNFYAGADGGTEPVGILSNKGQWSILSTENDRENIARGVFFWNWTKIIIDSVEKEYIFFETEKDIDRRPIL